MITKRVTIPYKPRELQQEIHQAIRTPAGRVRFVVLAVHRRFGKSVLAINELIDGALTNPLHNPRYFYIAPTQKQARSIAWDYIKEFTRDIPDMKYYETDLRCEFPNGARIQLTGAENFEVIRGNYIDGCVMDEFGNMNPLAWREVIRPAMSDRMIDGKPSGWVIILGTPNGKNHFFDIYREAQSKDSWLARTYAVSETKLIPEGELEDARSTMGEEEYLQEFECSWQAAVRGSYYGTEVSRVFKDGRVLNIPLARQLPVDISFDLGMDDATSLWFSQSVGNELRLIRYHEWTNTPLLDILDELRRPPFDQYRYGECWLPHDAEVRSMNDGITRTETIEASNMFQEVTVTTRIPVADGINAVRQLLPRCYFDKNNAMGGLDCLDNYSKKYDPKTGVYKDTPNHNKFSNGADSFRYMAINYHPSLGDIQERATVRCYKSRNKSTSAPRVVGTNSRVSERATRSPKSVGFIDVR